MPLHLIDRIAVEDEGDGDAVLCLHGLGGSSNTFTPLMPVLARHRVLRIDLPGSARSQRVEGDLSIGGFVAAVQAVCAKLEIRRAHVVAHSMGCIVAQHLALAMPALVRSLALFGPLLAPTDTARTALRSRASQASWQGMTGMHDIAVGLVNAALSSHTRQTAPLAVAFVRESLMRQDGAAYGRSCLALADAHAAAVDRITVPALLVTGDEDAVAPPQAVRSLAEKLHHAASVRVVVLPRCGHWAPVERPDDCQRELAAFLAAQR